MGQWGFDKNYNPTQGGTMPATMQRIIGAMYTNSGSGPLMKGGAVSGRTDRMYNYSAGVGIITTSAGSAMITWEAGQTSLVSQPSTERVDVIWANEGGVFVAPGGVGVPSNACILDKRRLPAGATSTQPSVSVWDKNYALPYGGSLGYLGVWSEPSHPDGALVPHEWWDVCRFDFSVPTDRSVDVIVRQSIYGERQASGPLDLQLGMGSMQWAANLDGVLMESWDMGFDGRWVSTFGGIRAWKLSAGTHQIQITRRKSPTWNAVPKWFGGGPNKYCGTWVGLLDVGVAE
ncbi:hypothetical protein HJ590_13130 [Naumannella sp. ID2617S]|nr:hypothetical protein [Naumannella sp. ID2617S]